MALEQRAGSDVACSTVSASVEITSESVILHALRGNGWAVKWSEVHRLEAYKGDRLTTDDVCLAFYTASESHVVNEEAPGWRQLVEAISTRFGVRQDWCSIVVQTPFATNRMILWDRAVMSAVVRNEPLDELWARAKSDLAPDGALRDIYICNTAIDDWNTTIAIARGICSEVIISSADGTPSLNDLAEEHFDGTSRAHVKIRVDGFDLLGHCFSADEIELSFNPRDIGTIDRFTILLHLLVAIGVVLKRQVRVTPENLRNGPFIQIAPNGAATYIAPAA